MNRASIFFSAIPYLERLPYSRIYAMIPVSLPVLHIGLAEVHKVYQEHLSLLPTIIQTYLSQKMKFESGNILKETTHSMQLLKYI